MDSAALLTQVALCLPHEVVLRIGLDNNGEVICASNRIEGLCHDKTEEGRVDGFTIPGMRNSIFELIAFRQIDEWRFPLCIVQCRRYQ